MTDPRYRINATQTTKNTWYFNATAEAEDIRVFVSTNPDDVAVGEHHTLGKILLQIIKETEDEFRKDGRMCVSDCV